MDYKIIYGGGYWRFADGVLKAWYLSGVLTFESKDQEIIDYIYKSFYRHIRIEDSITVLR